MDLRNSKMVTIITINVILFLMAVGLFFYKSQQIDQEFNEPIIEQPRNEKPINPNNPPRQENIGLQDALKIIEERKGKEYLSWLAHDDREGRMSGKKGNTVSADYIEKVFAKSGLQTKRQRFNIRRLNNGPNNERGNTWTENIIGIIPGKSKRKIIIGAHMDHIGYGPSMSRTRSRDQVHNGADDNASGTTAIMQIAEAFGKMGQPNHTLEFIAFSAEEMGLIGAKHYVQQLSKAERDNIDLMVNFDMVGWLKNQNKISISGIRPIQDLVKIVNDLDDKYPFTAIAARPGGGGSDHAPFGNAGIPYAFFHTGGHAHYHTPSDDADRIDFKGLNEITKFATEMIYEFDQSKLVRKTSIDYPELNDTIHDHGHSDPEYSSTFPTERDYDENEQYNRWHSYYYGNENE